MAGCNLMGGADELPLQRFAVLERIRALLALNRSEEALAACDDLLAAQPDSPGVRGLRAHALLKLNQTHAALAAATQATIAEPSNGEAFVALGLASVRVGLAAQGLTAFDRALALQPSLGSAHAGRGLALAATGRSTEAIVAYERAAQLDPSDVGVFFEVGHLMLRLGRLGNAHAAFNAALQLQPNHILALEGRTKTLAALNRHEEALPGFVALCHAAPGLDYLRGAKFHSQLHCCDWSEFDRERRTIAERVRSGERADNPFSFIVHNDSPVDQRRCAQTYVLDRFPTRAPALNRRASRAPSRLRVAYLSADLRDHPVAQLMAGVFESHDRSRIETYAFSAGPDDGSSLRQRLQRSFDLFMDVTDMQDAAIAVRMAELSIDVAVDLGGHTTGSRTRVLAFRPSPVQVAFLGFPGTLGADFVDYIVADRHVIPEVDRIHYAEQVIYLPDAYLPIDVPSAFGQVPDRRAAGLPPTGVTFCSFNAAYKILPTVFDMWMRILKSVPDGVLWLRDASDAAKGNLAKEAARRHVDPSRLIYAPRAPTLADHRARLSLADVFLDTQPYNAHTTASDALGAGVPVITLRGKSFASRVATSLLHAVGLGHLSVETPEAYERLAIELARTPSIVADLKAHLHRARSTAPLFDTALFCRHLEAAYIEIYARHERGESPSTLWVERVRNLGVMTEGPL
jgi:protein O-GlcNAc transferase